MLALTPLALLGCAEEPPVTTTTTVTRETTTTGPVVATEPVASDVYVAQTPPTVRVETRTLAPGPGFSWTPGYWRWNGATYVWVSGTWIRPPRTTAVWVPGHWVHRPPRLGLGARSLAISAFANRKSDLHRGRGERVLAARCLNPVGREKSSGSPPEFFVLFLITAVDLVFSTALDGLPSASVRRELRLCVAG